MTPTARREATVALGRAIRSVRGGDTATARSSLLEALGWLPAGDVPEWDRVLGWAKRLHAEGPVSAVEIAEIARCSREDAERALDVARAGA